MQRVAASALGVLLTLVVATESRAQAQALPELNEQGLQMAYRFARAAHTGFEYQLNVAVFPDCNAAQSLWERWRTQPPAMTLGRLNEVRGSRGLAFEFPPQLREALWRMTRPLDRSGVVRLANGRCLLAELARATKADMPPLDTIAERLRTAVRRDNVTHPDRPEFARRMAFEDVLDAAALARLPADEDVNTRLLNGETLLMRAILSGESDFLAALVKRGANVNQCVPAFCPLATAAFRKDRALDLSRQLLAAGADPNQFDAGLRTYLPLGIAALEARLDLMRLLLDAGAKASGVPGATPPLRFAAEKGSREAMALLIERGADLVWRQGLPTDSAYLAAKEHAGLAAWLEPQIVAASTRQGRLDWSGWIEQDGKRYPLAGGDIRLKRAPFRFVFRLATPEEGIAVQAMDAPLLHQQVRAADRTASLTRGIATASAEDDNDTTLNVWREKDSGPGYHAWAVPPTNSRLKPGAVAGEWIKEITGINTFEVDPKADAERVDVARSPHAVIYLALATQLMLSPLDSQLHKPQLVRLMFQ